MRNALSIWTVYDHPRDYPNMYVARLWRNDKPTQSIILSVDLEMLRNTLQFEMGLTCITRSPTDDPVIMETWL